MATVASCRVVLHLRLLLLCSLFSSSSSQSGEVTAGIQLLNTNAVGMHALAFASCRPRVSRSMLLFCASLTSNSNNLVF